MSPQLIYGTATFGMDLTGSQDAEAVRKMLETIWSLGIKRLDTAPLYPPLRQGRAEQLLGEAVEISRNFTIDTKVSISTATDGSGELACEAIEQSVHDSLQRLKRPQGVHLLYAHRTDPATPLAEQIQSFNEQIVKGHCKAWGVSNTPPAVLQEILRICDENGWQKPSVYQGDYDLVTRGMETKLLPLMRAHGMSFVAFRVLGAGFLTGKLVNNQHKGTRLSEDNPIGKHLHKVFENEELHQAVKKFDTKVKAQGLSSLEVAIRWASHHSALRDDDAIILGASRNTQLQETVSLIRRGPLPSLVLGMVGELWAAVQQTREDFL